MLFASTALVSRIERAECSLISSCIGAMDGALEGPERFATSFGGGVAGYSGADSPFNKVVGIGMNGPLDENRLEELERRYARRNTAVQVELPSLADPSFGERLTQRGYRLVGIENVLGRSLSEIAVEPSSRLSPKTGTSPGIEISESDEADLDVWLDTVVGGFAVPDEAGVPSHESFAREVLEEVLSDMTKATGIVRYLARRDGDPAGAASLRVHGGVAQLNGASTLPKHRRRGVQAALLAHRLAEAAKAGCEVAVVTTQPGSTSQKNVQRKGFELLYSRSILVLSGRSTSG